MVASPASPPPRFKVLREIGSGSLAAGFTASLFSPLELVKTRLQVQHQFGQPLYRGLGHALRRIASEEGAGALWRHGFAGFVARDLTYSGFRIGLYPTVRSLYSGDAAGGGGGGDAGLLVKILSGCTTGMLGSALANPVDVVRVRTSVESGALDAATGRFKTGLCAGAAPRFAGFGSCARQLASEPLASGAYGGVGASMARAAALSGGQLASYDHCKYLFLKHGVFADDGAPLHCFCAIISGLVAVTACNPPDVVKSRLMLSQQGGGAATTSAAAVVRDIWQAEGLRGFYRGWLPAASRAVPAFFIQMPVVEQLRLWLGVETL